jgi:hypothetical protein
VQLSCKIFLGDEFLLKCLVNPVCAIVILYTLFEDLITEAFNVRAEYVNSLFHSGHVH